MSPVTRSTRDINLRENFGEQFGGRDRDRTDDPLLAKIGRAKNQQVTPSAMEYYGLLQVHA
jgi:hypothetical protein